MSEQKTEQTEQKSEKVKITLNTADLREIKKETATAISKYFCKKDNKTEISFNSLSQILKHFETDLSDFTHKCMTLHNDSRKMSVNRFKKILSAYILKIEV